MGGQGSQYFGMAHELYIDEPRFREVMDEMEEFVRDVQGMSIVDYLYDPRRGYGDPCDDLALTNAAIVMVEVSLFQLLDAHGVRPRAVVGSSLGEFAGMAALSYVDWSVVLDTVIDLGRRLCRRAGDGRLLTVLGDVALHADVPELRGTEVTSVNYDGHFVLAGSEDEISHAERALDRRGVATMRLPITTAFHSSRIEHARTAAMAGMRGVCFDRPDSILYSSATAARVTRGTPETCWEILRRPIRFTDTVSAVPAGPKTIHIDLTPSSSLAAIMRGSHPERATRAIITPFRKEQAKVAALAADGAKIRQKEVR